MTYQSFTAIFKTMRYPAGESHVRIAAGVGDAELSAVSVIEARATSFDDLGNIVTADRILSRLGRSVEWFLPYFPFARHDRRNDRLDGFELELAMSMVAELNVVIADPHSDVSGQLRHFDQATAVDAFERMGLFDTDPLVVIPDAGAAKKAYTWLDGRDVIQATKHRDPKTGDLSGFAVPVGDLDGRPCIIIDDICDGGGTFLGLAAELESRNAGPLTLAVTHGLFTKGTRALAQSYSTIATFTYADSDQVSGVATIPFSELYMKGSIT